MYVKLYQSISELEVRRTKTVIFKQNSNVKTKYWHTWDRIKNIFIKGCNLCIYLNLSYLLVELGSGVVIGHAVLVGVHGSLVGVDLWGVGRGVGGGVLGHGGGGQEGKGKGDLE